MALSKSTYTSILKETNLKSNLASKRFNHSFTNRSYTLPPSLRNLPTMSSGPLSSRFSDISQLSPIRNSSTNNSYDNNESELDLTETMLDEWLVRFDKVTTSSSRNKGDATDAATRSPSKVTFSTSISTVPTPSRKLDSVTVSEQQQERPAKRRRFSRRNSFVVRDLTQLAKLAPAGGDLM
mmetsp:Transcript_17137/g.39572  ORF Transcript_17137/g.39572 Transcript_17137/m.39572 type:complete len:181 (+) Transcript_17137:227-769(+)